MKFYSSIRLDVRRGDKILQQGLSIGNRTKVKVVKNKVAPPFREVEFDIMYGKGISGSGDILDLAVTCGVVQKSGAWYAYTPDGAVEPAKLGQGRENAKQYLELNPELCTEIEEKIRKKHEPDPAEDTAPAENAPELTERAS